MNADSKSINKNSYPETQMGVVLARMSMHEVHRVTEWSDKYANDVNICYDVLKLFWRLVVFQNPLY